GPHSKKTLDYILKLIKKGYLIYPLRGNHEETLIYTSENESKKILKWLVRKSPNLLNQGKLHTKYKDFIKSLPFYYELDNFFLVHANFNYNIEKPFKDKSSMLWKRKFDYNAKTLKNKTLVHGHQPTEIGDIKCMIRKKKKVICLDNGVNYIRNHKLYNYLQMGSLCALNLDTFELTIQKNIEFEKKNANTILI
ncbi:MAG: metallophosphoesterase, partial [Bacteroidales bacterium]|nr:metallophosphoesterase [Bacteroidales bacterium]